MKTEFRIVAKIPYAVAIAALMVSCTVTDISDPTDSETPSSEINESVLSSTLEQPVMTKTSLTGNDTDGYDTVWAAGDQISVIGLAGGTSKSQTFTLESGEGTQNGSFTGTFPQGCTDMYAVFPGSNSSAAMKADGSAITMKIPERKATYVNNIAQNLMPSVAKVVQSNGNSSVELHNLFGLLRVTLSSPTTVRFRKMELIDLGGNMLWGDCTIPIVNGEPDYSNITLAGGTNSIYLEAGNVTITSTPKSFYFSVPPGALDRGFAVRIFEYDESKSNNVGKEYSVIQKITGTKAVVRSSILSLASTTIADKSEPYSAKERGYYKTLFVDAGIMLDSFYSSDPASGYYIPAIRALGLENDYEYLQTSGTSDFTITAQASIITGTNGDSNFPSDKNGVLLYPDGEPRFRMIFVNGGTSETHGTSLGDSGRRRIKKFFEKGGSYIGACAGAILASTNVDGVNRYDNTDPEVTNYTLGLWPGNASHTGWPANYGEEGINSDIYTGITVSDHFAQKTSMTANETIQPVRHHGGVYAQEKYVTSGNASYYGDTYVLGRYAYCYWQQGWPATAAQYANPDNLNDVSNDFLGTGRDHNGQVAIWAYKPNDDNYKGCVVMSGSHFETSTNEDQVNYFSSMIQYALDGNGSYQRSRSLTLGTTRKMTNTSYDENGENWNARIGDRQYHHFKLVTTEDLQDFVLDLDSEFDKDSGIDLYLCLHKGGYAFVTNSEYVLTNKGGQKSLHIKNLPAGTWYASVFCATTVETSEKIQTPRYLKYSGHTEVLDGIAYTLTPHVEAAASTATKASGDEFTDTFDE